MGWDVEATLRHLAKLLRWLPWGWGRAVLATGTNLAVTRTLKGIHLNVLHRIRRLAVQLKQGNLDQSATLAQQICTEMNRQMCRLLELEANRLHCCIKLLEKPDQVSTWVRSEPLDNRPPEIGADNAHEIDKNSVWAALYGRSDGATIWQPFTCFACNDLTTQSQFRCDRHNWQNFYRATLVFPLRYPADQAGNEFLNLGFLAFDSPLPGAFRGIPNIFDFVLDPTGYRDKLEKSAIFHLGSIFADTLATVLSKGGLEVK